MPPASRIGATSPSGLRRYVSPVVRFCIVPGKMKTEYPIVIAGRNFGCGSSREHAPIALSAAGIEAVVAEFYARIFFRNSVNGGYLVPFETGERLCEKVCTGDELTIDVAAGTLTNRTTGETWPLKPLGEIAPILEAGGIFPYAQRVGMLKT